MKIQIYHIIARDMSWITALIMTQFWAHYLNNALKL